MRPLAFRERPVRETLRTRRRRVRVLAMFFVMSLAVGAAYGLSYTSYLPQFSVQRVEVEGTKEIRPALVRTYVETVLFNGTYPFFSRANVLLYPRAEIETRVKEYFPRIERVRVSRESFLATAVVVSVQEREAFARWCTSSELVFTGESSESCYVMDKSGFLFAPVQATTGGFSSPYMFRGDISGTSTGSTGSPQAPLGQTYLPGTFAGILALLERLGQTGLTPRTISAGEEGDFSIALEEGFELRASFGADISALVRNLELVLSSETLRGKENELEYVDLRFGNRVYYKLKGEEQQSAE